MRQKPKYLRGKKLLCLGQRCLLGLGCSAERSLALGRDARGAREN